MPELVLHRRPAAQVMTLALYLCLIGEGLFLYGPGCRTLVSARSCAVMHEVAPILVAVGVIGAAIASLRFATLWRPEVALEAEGVRLLWRGLIPWSAIEGAGPAGRGGLPSFGVELRLHDRRAFLAGHWRGANGPARPLLWFWTWWPGALLLGRFTRINVFGTGASAAELAAAINRAVARHRRQAAAKAAPTRASATSGADVPCSGQPQPPEAGRSPPPHPPPPRGRA
ncbi:MAG: hypothetical protein QNJ30_23550 [Kiloniellales bacterium]|nr:hypothetical protein [Kiloniellales bacterium]